MLSAPSPGRPTTSPRGCAARFGRTLWPGFVRSGSVPVNSKQAVNVAKLLCRRRHRALHLSARHLNDRFAALPVEICLCRIVCLGGLLKLPGLFRQRPCVSGKLHPHRNVKHKQKVELACWRVRQLHLWRQAQNTWHELQSKASSTVPESCPSGFSSSTQTRHLSWLSLRSLKTARKGSSPGPGGCTCEHLKDFVDDQDTLELRFETATSLAAAALTTAWFPFQCAMSTRVWTDCVGELAPTTTC